MGRDASYFDSQVLSFEAIGGFPMEIKTKLRYVLICSYHVFTLQNYTHKQILRCLILFFIGNLPIASTMVKKD